MTEKNSKLFGGFTTVSCFFTLANLTLILQACHPQHDCLLLSKHVLPGKQDPPHFCFLTVCSTHASSTVSNVSSWEGQAHQSQGEPRLLGGHDSLLERARARALMGYKGQPRHRLYFSTETTTSTTPCSELYSVIRQTLAALFSPVFLQAAVSHRERACWRYALSGSPQGLEHTDVFFP